MSAAPGRAAIPATSVQGGARMFQLTALPPLTLYVHVPWCVRKCPYCDFNSHELQADLPERDYVAALTADLEQELPQIWGRTVESIFIGGGTPSLLAPDTIDLLLSNLRARLALAPGLEITLEANPGTIDRVRLSEFRAAGVNRLSIGVQSFDDGLLARIGRIHDGAAAHTAAAAAAQAGFDNWNLDLMYGLPGQDAAQALADVRAAVALAPAHVSHYQLTIEPNTAFHHRPPPLPDDDALWEMQERCQEALAAGGYEQYEVSAYARPGRRCHHNLNYWRFGDYLGIGAGAHGKLSDARSQSIRRSAKVKHPRVYLEQAAGPGRIATHTELAASDAVIEFMMNALRLNDGFPAALFPAHTGLPLSVLGDALARAESRGLIERDPLIIRPTERGRRYLNELIGMF